MKLVAILLTLNDARHLRRSLGSLEGVVDHVLVTDSFSGHETGRIAESHGAQFVQHAFVILCYTWRKVTKMQRKFAHWRPTYIRNRLLVIYDERKHLGKPWLTRDGVRFLDQALRPTDVGLEFGSAAQTRSNCNRQISIKDNHQWYAKVSRLIAEQNLADKNDYRFREAKDEYVAEASRVADEPVDFCLVDGSHRDECAIRVIARVKRGGLLVVDNINWYLPGDSIAPTSRRPSDGRASAASSDSAAAVRDWRRYWTSNGVTDTCNWLKP